MADTATKRLRITDLDVSDRPRERLLASGAHALSDAELLAILLRTGVPGANAVDLAQRLLRDHGGWAGLQRLSSAELARTHGVGHAKAAQIKAALEIGRRLLLAEPPQRRRVNNPTDVAALLMHEMSQLPQEHLRVVLLNTRAEILGIETVVIGSIDHADVRVADVFRDALRVGAASMVLAHNHPSGDPTPSSDDVVLTDVLIEAGQLLGLPIRDHLIIGQGRWVSLRERGYRFAD